jgi:signal transduction histidine kinase
VLDFSKLEKGLLRVECVEVDISKICSEALDLFKFRLEREKIRLVRRIEPAIKAMADPVAVTQVIFNIVDNAITYSEAGSSIEVELARDARRVRLLVKDNGAGIDDALKPHVFDPFVRGTDSRITSKRGTGLGLHVVSQLAERMNCTVRIYDNVPGGTVVEVTFPTPGPSEDRGAQA